jgi:hypothetical protein
VVVEGGEGVENDSKLDTIAKPTNKCASRCIAITTVACLVTVNPCSVATTIACGLTIPVGTATTTTAIVG